MSPQYLLPCLCGREIPVDSAQAGGRTRCTCGAELEVPSLLGLRRLKRAELAADPRERDSGTIWGLRQRLVLAGSVVSLVGIVLAVGSFLTRPRLVDVAEYPPLATLRLWEESLKLGVDLPPSPFELAMFAAMERHHRWTVAGLAIAVLGVVVMGSSMLVGRRSRTQPPPVS